MNIFFGTEEMASAERGICLGCKEDTMVREVLLFECLDTHPFCDSCINSTELTHCPEHELSSRLPQD